MRKFAIVLMMLSVVSIGQAFILADFETDVDGFVAINTPLSTLETSTTAGTVTSGLQSLKVTHNPTNYWPIQWQAPSIPSRLGKLAVDITIFAADWPTGPWTRFNEKIALQSDGASGGGWDEYLTSESNWIDRNTGEPAPVDWGNWQGDCVRTVTIDISDYDLTGATFFTINMSFNCGTEGPYYLDNLRIVDEPYNPNPVDGGAGGLSTDLSWNNAIEDANSVAVWFGIAPEPNEADPNTILGPDTYKTLLSQVYYEEDPGATSTCPNANIGTLTESQVYTWCVETEPNYIPVPFWTFTASANIPPDANAGVDQFTWLNPLPDPNVVITLDGSASSDDGLIAPLTYTWTQTGGPTVDIDDPSAASPTFTTDNLGNNTEADSGDPYVFELTVDDGQFTDTDTVTVYVNSTSCSASNEAANAGGDPAGYYRYGDITGPDAPEGEAVPDCKVDLYDFVEVAINWLACSNIFEPCP